MVLKKLRFFAFIFVIFVICLFSLYQYWSSNPNAKHNSAAAQTLEKFYAAFLDENYAAVALLVESHNPQMVINVRHWYGQVEKYQIKTIRNLKNQQKEAKILVTSYRNNEIETNTDTILLTRQQDEWLIKSYRSDLEYKLP